MDTEYKTPEAAQKVLDEVRAAVAGWREVALSPEVGLTQKELRGFEGSMERINR